MVQSDQGSNFSSKMFRQMLKLLRITQNQSSAYHAQSQCALERFHQTLKSLLRAYCTELDKDWEEGLPWLLLAAREAVQESTGFSPNELVFGHAVHGPLAVLKGECMDMNPPTNLEEYVNGFRHRLFLAGCMAREKQGLSQRRMKELYDHRTEHHEFNPGDQVLALMPIVGSPFQAKYAGPYTITEKVSDLNYIVATPGWRKTNGVLEPDDSLLCGRLKNSESLSNLDKWLTCQSPNLMSCRSWYVNFWFGDIPSQTDRIEHDIDVGDARPIKQQFYCMAPDKRDYLEAEVAYMLQNDITVPSSSSWASPCILVPKQDGTPRFCTDLRKVNGVTKSDSFHYHVWRTELIR